MKIYNSLPNKSLLFLSILLGVFMTFAGISPSKSTSYKQQNQKTLIESDSQFPVEDIRIANKTKGFTVQRITRQDNIIKLELRNAYSKPITGYQIYVGGKTIQTELLVNNDPQIVLPGASVHKQYPDREEIRRQGITILAVLFDDHTGDGDPHYLKRLLQYREGMKMQRLRALDALQKVLDSGVTNLIEALEQVMSEIPTLSNEEMKQLPWQVQFGIKDEKTRLQRVTRTLFNELRQSQNLKETAPIPAHLQYQKASSFIEKYKKTIEML
jgi:ElaB/YqjD/DUF883 family membrane-anchored ribosome-binding protein